MKKLLDFYTSLAAHNEKPWFDAHKGEYLEAKNYYEGLAMDILHGLQGFDPDLEGLRVQDVTYRIYRDQRFHNNPPYKSWVGLYFARNGKKSPYAGYYLHIEPSEDTFFICGGLYREIGLITKSVREEIMLNGENFDRLMNPGEGWRPDFDSATKRVPNGWPADEPYSKYFRLKNFLVMKPVDRKYLLQSNLAERVAEDFRPIVPLVQCLNRAVDYAIDEWGLKF